LTVQCRSCRYPVNGRDQLTDQRQDWEDGAHVGPAHEIATPVLKFLEGRVVDHLVGEIDVESVFHDGEASVNCAVSATKFLVRGKVEDLTLGPEFGLPSDSVNVTGTSVVEPALAVGFGVFVEAFPEARRGQIINISGDEGHETTDSRESLASLDPSSQVGSLRTLR